MNNNKEIIIIINVLILHKIIKMTIKLIIAPTSRGLLILKLYLFKLDSPQNFICVIPTINSEDKVAIAAPIIPYVGIRIKFNTMFTIAPSRTETKKFFSLF